MLHCCATHHRQPSQPWQVSTSPSELGWLGFQGTSAVRDLSGLWFCNWCQVQFSLSSGHMTFGWHGVVNFGLVLLEHVLNISLSKKSWILVFFGAFFVVAWWQRNVMLSIANKRRFRNVLAVARLPFCTLVGLAPYMMIFGSLFFNSWVIMVTSCRKPSAMPLWFPLRMKFLRCMFLLFNLFWLLYGDDTSVHTSRVYQMQCRWQSIHNKFSCWVWYGILYREWSCDFSLEKKLVVFWCRKCGKFVTRLKHVRLKITSVPCTQSELPVARWLAKEGFLQSESRLDQNRKDLETFNKGGHDLDWNRRVGKVPGAPDEGIITCRSCKLTWSWRYRHTTLKNSICKGPSEPASTATCQTWWSQGHVRQEGCSRWVCPRWCSILLVLLSCMAAWRWMSALRREPWHYVQLLSFQALTFLDPLGLSGLSADKDVEVFKRPGGILDTHEDKSYDATLPQVALQNACPLSRRWADLCLRQCRSAGAVRQRSEIKRAL